MCCKQRSGAKHNRRKPRKHMQKKKKIRSWQTITFKRQRDLMTWHGNVMNDDIYENPSSPLPMLFESDDGQSANLGLPVCLFEKLRALASYWLMNAAFFVCTCFLALHLLFCIISLLAAPFKIMLLFLVAQFFFACTTFHYYILR